MLTIIFRHQNNNAYMERRDAEIGDTIEPVVPIDSIVSILASDTELDFIYRNFEGIPKRYRADSLDVSWFGDDAKFIAANWK